MSYSTRIVALLLPPLASLACSAPAAHDAPLGTRSTALTAGAVASLVALQDATSDGGIALTDAETAAYVALVPGFGGDESIDALAVLPTFRDPESTANIAAVTRALRHHVVGLRIAGMTVTGLTIDACGGRGAAATFDPKGAPYAGVRIVYSGDHWATNASVDLAKGADGLFRAALPGLDAHGTVVFALAVTQPNGDTLWLNNPRENAAGVASHLDYGQALDLCESFVTPATPHLARYVRALARPETLGGATVTWDEMSALVAHTTYEGGPGMDDADVIDPALAELDAMKGEGITFEADTYSVMRNFLSQMRMRVATADGLRLVRVPVNDDVIIAAPPGSQFMRVYYSTDGWSSPKVVECTPLGRAGLVNCELGFVPEGALVSYSAVVRDARGRERAYRAADGGNAFQKAR